MSIKPDLWPKATCKYMEKIREKNVANMFPKLMRGIKHFQKGYCGQLSLNLEN